MLKNKKSSKKNFNFFSFFTGYNIFIFILFLISSSFVISIIDRHLRFGIKMDYNFSNTPPDLIIDPFPISQFPIIQFDSILTFLRNSGLTRILKVYLS